MRCIVNRIETLWLAKTMKSLLDAEKIEETKTILSDIIKELESEGKKKETKS